jgi:hypothetical protein
MPSATSSARTLAAIAVAAVACAAGRPAAAAPAAPAGARTLVLQADPAQARQGQRLALVIGNSAYKEAPLVNPVNDAQAMARALEAAGFNVMLRTNVDQRGMLNATRDFGNQLRQGGGVGLFYFAGHGMQIKGRNYLIPVGADIQREDEVAYAALDAQAVLDKMESAGNGANVMILDACRNNPFARSFRSSGQGLAQMEAPVGTLVAFATAPGSVASDGQGVNGLYTQHLLSAMSRPGAKVEDVFKQVRAAVRRDSQGKQIPWESTSLEGDLFFVAPPAPTPAPPPPDPAAALDNAMWETVRGSGEAVELRAYLKRFPEGRHAAEARQMLARLEAARPAAAAPAPAVATAPAPTLASAAGAALKPPPGSDEARVIALLEEASARRPQPQAHPAPAVAGNQPLAEPAGAPPASSVAAGPAVGDSWHYERNETWPKAATSQFTRTVAQVDAAGTIRFEGDDGYVHSFTRLTSEMVQREAFGHTAAWGQDVWWSGMKPGEKRKISMRTVHRRGDGAQVQAELSATVRFHGKERVRVPAGEFEALRAEAEGQLDWPGAPPNGSVRQHFSMVFWYAPEVRGLVASDLDAREPGSSRPGTIRRAELIRTELRGGAVASR